MIVVTREKVGMHTTNAFYTKQSFIILKFDLFKLPF